MLFSFTGLSPSKVSLSRELQFNSLALAFTTSLPFFQTEIQFALFPFRSLLFRESQLFSFPTGTKMFQFPAYVSLSARSYEHVFTFGDLGFNARMRLTQAYRSLPRPSSQSKPSYPSSSLNNKIKSPEGKLLYYFPSLFVKTLKEF